MKHFFILALLLVGVTWANSAQARRVRIPLGLVEHITVVQELPDTEYYVDTTYVGYSAKSDPSYFDLATRYTTFEIAGIPIYIDQDPHLVLFGSKTEELVYVSEESMQELVLEPNGLDGEALLVSPSFWDKYGGKMVFLLIIYIIYRLMRSPRNKNKGKAVRA